MYAEDSFYTLSRLGQIGLAVLSLILFVAIVIIVYRLTRNMPFFVRPLIALAAFWAFVWLSPQIYYLYYLTLFDGLPLQNVIQPPPSLMKILKLVIFQNDATLSAHSQGGLAWALVATALWPSRKKD